MNETQHNNGKPGAISKPLLDQVVTDLSEVQQLADFSLLVATVVLGPQTTENTLACSDCGRIYDNAVVCQSDDCPSNLGDTLWTVYSENGNPSFEVNALSSQEAMREALNSLGWSVMKKR